jgi:hypothetical protein
MGGLCRTVTPFRFPVLQAVEARSGMWKQTACCRTQIEIRTAFRSVTNCGHLPTR